MSAAPTPEPAAPMPAMPHVPLAIRMLLTWTAILPLVLLVRFALAPLVASWPDVLGFALTVTIVVPIAVGFAVPMLTRGYHAMRRRSR
ncbi:hypothetical protein [Leucobacter musarum]|uniref:hypothetical protein n=1 Tax=Leucobacter musarum TaxID=1930747 RepID=UPI000A7FCC51|nr:hypothetical protein [Leucobacter musarum]